MKSKSFSFLPVEVSVVVVRPEDVRILDPKSHVQKSTSLFLRRGRTGGNQSRCQVAEKQDRKNYLSKAERPSQMTCYILPNQFKRKKNKEEM